MTEPTRTSEPPSNRNCTADIIHYYPCTQLEKIEEKCLLQDHALTGVVIFICTLGLIGNGTVFWLLGFCIKRNFFSVYVLNLAAADFGVLTALWGLYICVWSYTDPPGPSTSLSKVYDYFIYLFFFVQCSSIHLLTAISVDRCLVILFPAWHRFQRPKHLSAIVSSVLWGVSGIYLGMITFCSCCHGTNETITAFFLMVVSIMVISTAILSVKVCCNSRLRQHGKVHLAILLSLLFFFITTVPISLFVRFHANITSISSVLLLLTSVNSSINPVIYFLIGRYQSFGQSRMSIKDVLRRMFRKEEDSGNEARTTSVSSSLMTTLRKTRPSGSVPPTPTASCLPGSPTEEFHVT